MFGQEAAEIEAADEAVLGEHGRGRRGRLVEVPRLHGPVLPDRHDRVAAGRCKREDRACVREREHLGEAAPLENVHEAVGRPDERHDAAREAVGTLLERYV